jgi:6-phosphogluconolactonase (cycloisomerase 2 family)
VLDPSGQFAYAANDGSGDISAYAVDATTGALIPVSRSPFAAGSEPRAVAID